MQILFVKDAWEDYLYWQKTNKKILQKINQLIKASLHEAFSGIGKPESLKFSMLGYWSRRINAEHHLVYKAEDHNLIIIQCKYHY